MTCISEAWLKCEFHRVLHWLLLIFYLETQRCALATALFKPVGNWKPTTLTNYIDLGMQVTFLNPYQTLFSLLLDVRLFKPYLKGIHCCSYSSPLPQTFRYIYCVSISVQDLQGPLCNSPILNTAQETSLPHILSCWICAPEETMCSQSSPNKRNAAIT